MNMKVLIVVDMQNDFVTGALNNKEAVKIVPNVVNKVRQAMADGETIIFTRDTHDDSYMKTEEGKNLPVPHCLQNTFGHEIVPELKEYSLKADIIDKPVFGSIELGNKLKQVLATEDTPIIEFVGVCTDICVISNTVIARSAMPNAHIIVDASCCAGVTPESHRMALKAMSALQVEIINEEV